MIDNDLVGYFPNPSKIKICPLQGWRRTNRCHWQLMQLEFDIT